MKKILLIAYHYHPDLAVGAQRTIKYAKYLPRFGWQPHVLTVRPRYYSKQDDAPLEFESPVHRTSKWPAPDDVYRTVNRLLGRSRPESSQPSEAPVSASEPTETGETKPFPLWKKFFGSLSTTPDPDVGWYPPAVFAALRLIRQHRFDVIYSSGPPHTCHLIALTAHRLTGTPWVVDFRDPWAFPKHWHQYVLAFTERLDKRFEEKAVRHASLVLTTTDEWREHLMRIYHPLLDAKCHTIVNGFDDEDFPAIRRSRPRKQGARITFLHAGNLYAGRDPSSLLVAVGELVADGHIQPGEVEFQFYGTVSMNMTQLARLLAEYRLDKMVTFADPVKRSEYIDMLMKSDVLTLFQSEASRVCIPAKAFEYLATGNVILSLTSDGATKNFLSDFGQVFVARPDDKEQIKDNLMKILTRLKADLHAGSANPKVDAITKRKLTEKFAGLLDGIQIGS